MRALVAVPAASEHIALRVVPDPEVRADETLVRVRAISLNRGEVNRLAAAEEGTVLGWDVAGTVEHPAERGGDLEVGTRVVAILPGGGWAEMVGVPASRLVEIPDGLSFEAASTLPVAGLTALRTLQLGGLLLGKRVLITGAAGGVGRFAVQLASQSGAQVTAIARDAARAEGLHGLGADEVIDDIENAAGDFHLILESVGGDSLATATRLVAPAGLIVTFGNSSHRPSSFDVSRFYGRNGARIQAFSLLASSQPDFRADLRFLAHEMANRRLDPQIGMETAWTEAARVLRALKAREVQGKGVLRVE